MNDWQEAETKAQRAERLFSTGQWRMAATEIAHAISINPDVGAWHILHGRVLDKLGRPGEAIRAYKTGLDLEPSDPQAWHELSKAYLQLGRAVDALEALERISQIDPEAEYAYCGRIAAHAMLDEHDLAEEMFYTARLYTEKCGHCLDHMAMSWHMRGETTRAIGCWEQALDLEDRPDGIQLKLAQTLHTSGEWEQARVRYLLALRENAYDEMAAVGLGQVLMAMGRFEEAEIRLLKALDVHPTSCMMHLTLARVLLGRLQMRQQHTLPLAGGLHKHDQPWIVGDEARDPWNGKSETQTELINRLASAAEVASKLDPTQPGVHLMLAKSLLARYQQPSVLGTISRMTRQTQIKLGTRLTAGRSARSGADQADTHSKETQAASGHVSARLRAEVRSHLRKEMMLRGHDVSMLRELANLLLDQRLFRLAGQVLVRVIKSESTHSGTSTARYDTQSNWAWHDLAVVWFSVRQFERGKAATMELLSREPGNISAMRNLILACEKTGHLDEGLRWVNHALEAQPGDRLTIRLAARLKVRQWLSGWKSGLYLAKWAVEKVRNWAR